MKTEEQREPCHITPRALPEGSGGREGWRGGRGLLLGRQAVRGALSKDTSEEQLHKDTGGWRLGPQNTARGRKLGPTLAGSVRIGGNCDGPGPHCPAGSAGKTDLPLCGPQRAQM